MTQIIHFASTAIALSAIGMLGAHPVSLAAQDTAPPVEEHAKENVVLWQDLRFGDSPDHVAALLQDMPDIKRARVRGRDGKKRVSIKYEDKGIEVLDETMALALEFKNDRLHHVGLGTAKTCAHNMWTRWSQLNALLAQKYPTELSEPLLELDFIRARNEATQENPSVLVTRFTDGQTMVAQTIHFHRYDPPPSAGFSTSKFVRQMSAILWNEYRTKAGECDGDGRNRVQLLVTYVSKAQFESEYANAVEERQEEVAEARAKI